jgi:hypothetical protein
MVENPFPIMLSQSRSSSNSLSIIFFCAFVALLNTRCNAALATTDFPVPPVSTDSNAGGDSEHLAEEGGDNLSADTTPPPGSGNNNNRASAEDVRVASSTLHDAIHDFPLEETPLGMAAGVGKPTGVDNE